MDHASGTGRLGEDPEASVETALIAAVWRREVDRAEALIVEGADRTPGMP